jgi:hypothetical protein
MSNSKLVSKRTPEQEARRKRWILHPFVVDAPSEKEREDRILALDYEEQRRNELAKDISDQALIDAKRGPVARMFHRGLDAVFFFVFGSVPVWFELRADEVREFFRRRTP